MLEKTICNQCKKPSVQMNHCPLCKAMSCKSCTLFMQDDAFSFMSLIPDEMSHSQYCIGCFTNIVAPALDNYKMTMARAKKVYIVERAPRKPLPILKKSATTVQVRNCRDREETILRLAFLSAELGFNTVDRVKIRHEKVGNTSYKKLVWHATGIPVELDGLKLERQEAQSAEL
jgi:hypothetical protein